MNGILIATLIMCLFIAALALGTKVYAEFCYRVMVRKHFDEINELMLTGDVPLQWRLHWLENLARRKASSVIGRGSGLFLRYWYVSKLKRTITYIKRSSMIKDDDKTEFISSLREMISEWTCAGFRLY